MGTKMAIKAKRAKSALARARWVRAIKSVMEANRAVGKWTDYRQQMSEFAAAFLKVLVLLALAYFLVCGGQQEFQESTVSDYVPTLNDGIVFQHADMPNALDYTEPKVCKKSNKISKKALRKPAAKKAAPVAKRASASVAVAKKASTTVSKKALPQAEKTSQ